MTTPDGLVAVAATAVHVDGGIVLLQPGLYGLEERLQPAFARHGIAFVDVAHPRVDPATAEVVVPEPVVGHDPAVLHTAPSAPGDEPDGEPEPVLPGRYPLLGWGRSHPGATPETRYSPAQGAAAFVPRILDTPEPVARIRELGDLFAHVPAFGIHFDSEDDLADTVARMFGVR